MDVSELSYTLLYSDTAYLCGGGEATTAPSELGAGPREQPQWQYRMQTEHTLRTSASRELAASWFGAVLTNPRTAMIEAA